MSQRGEPPGEGIHAARADRHPPLTKETSFHQPQPLAIRSVVVTAGNKYGAPQLSLVRKEASHMHKGRNPTSGTERNLTCPANKHPPGGQPRKERKPRQSSHRPIRRRIKADRERGCADMTNSPIGCRDPPARQLPKERGMPREGLPRERVFTGTPARRREAPPGRRGSPGPGRGSPGNA